MARKLVVFDFDLSLANANTDTEVIKKLAGSEIWEEVKRQFPQLRASWSDQMTMVLEKIHAKGVTKEDILDLMRSDIPLEADMIESVRLLHASGFDIVILSDANSVFIETILEKYNIRHFFREVITNPAAFNEHGRLIVRACFENREHSCPLCGANLCKGIEIERLVANGGMPYEAVMYVGDSNNDYCPSIKLTSRDFVLARQGMALHRRLTENNEHRATVVPWSDGSGVLEFTRTFVLS